MSIMSERPTPRAQADRKELAERIARALPRDGAMEPRPGLHFQRLSSPSERLHGVLEPSFCVIAQGSKAIFLGEDRFRYDPAHYLISTVGLPAIGKVVEASRERPYLSFRLVLDPSVVTSVLVESGVAHPRGDGSGVKAIDVSPLDTNLLDATLRLVRMTDTPGEYRALAPLVIREIIYRLLTDTQGNRLRHLATGVGHGHRIVRAVKRLNEDFAQPLRIEDIAHELGMSVSGFHAHFKAVTAMSPLQFQKHLRLQEARRLMMSEDLDAGEAGYRVGYDDQSHFSREYKRHFGEPPTRDVERLRTLAITSGRHQSRPNIAAHTKARNKRRADTPRRRATR
jgi:AraC-like DNA-binding protein